MTLCVLVNRFISAAANTNFKVLTFLPCTFEARVVSLLAEEAVVSTLIIHEDMIVGTLDLDLGVAVLAQVIVTVGMHSADPVVFISALATIIAEVRNVFPFVYIGLEWLFLA